MKLPANDLIVDSKAHFFSQGLSKGSYGLDIKLQRGSPKLNDQIFSAVKSLVLEPMPTVNKKARIHIPSGQFEANDQLEWLLAVFKRHGFSTQLVFDSSFGEPPAARAATWRILRVQEPTQCLIDFNELWFQPSASELPSSFQLWPMDHPIYLFLEPKDFSIDSILEFMNRTEFAWSLL